MEAVNHVRQPSDPAAIAAAAEHAYMCGIGHLAKIRDWMRVPPAGLDVLELGPGPDYGSTLTMATFGARVAVADRFEPPWDPAYHPKLYRTLANLIATRHVEAVAGILELVARAGGHPREIIPHFGSAERLEGAPVEAFDLVISNAVLEHVEDIEAVARRSFEVTRPGGFGAHQVDLRDHRNFDRPLEFLLMRPEEEARWRVETNGHLGAQRRAEVYEDAYRGAGFEILTRYVTERAEAGYLADFLARHRAAGGDAWRPLDVATLADTGIAYILRKPASGGQA